MKDDRTGLDVASVGDAEGVAALVGLDAPTADASLEALGRIVRAAWVEVAKKEAKTVPGYVDLWKWLEIPDADTDREIGEQVVRAVDASRPAAPEVAWVDDLRTCRVCGNPANRHAESDGFEIHEDGVQTCDGFEPLGPREVPRPEAAERIEGRRPRGSRPGLTERDAADIELARAVRDTLRETTHDGAIERLEELLDVEKEAAARPGLTEEQARLDFETACREARARGGAYCITKLGEALSTLDAALRASRGEAGPATEPTRAERVAEAQRLRAEARAEAEACTVPMPADLLVRYPRSADPPEPDRPTDLGSGSGGAPIRVRPTGASDPRATLHAVDPQKSGGNEP